MSTERQYYLNCNGCGKQFVGPDGTSVGETAEEIRDEAEDNGWLCYQGSSELDDYCVDCKTKSENDVI